MATQQLKVTVFEFKKGSNLKHWCIVNDVVMGGHSSGNFYLDDTGNGMYEGYISTKDNGGFSSLQYHLNPLDIDCNSSFEFKIKGDGSIFQFRIKFSKTDRHSYIYNFKTTGYWETVIIPVTEMEANYRGVKLNLPNFDKSKVEQIGFLKISKNNTKFNLILKSINLKKQ